MLIKTVYKDQKPGWKNILLKKKNMSIKSYRGNE